MKLQQIIECVLSLQLSYVFLDIFITELFPELILHGQGSA